MKVCDCGYAEELTAMCDELRSVLDRHKECWLFKAVAIEVLKNEIRTQILDVAVSNKSTTGETLDKICEEFETQVSLTVLEYLMHQADNKLGHTGVTH